MLIILKRGGILFIVLLLLVILLSYTVRKPDAVPSAANADNRIVIDAGHGAPDGGAVGKNTGALEKDLNLAIAEKVADKLRQNGETVIMTREDDRGLYTDEESSIREKKQKDMKKRVAIANSEGVSLFVSIHMNHFTDSKYSGPQIFYQTGSTEGARLAEEIRLSILNTIGPHCTREAKPTGDLYLLRQTKVPAVIVECGFLSNDEEEALLLDEGYQDKMAEAICTGIKNYKSTA